MRSPAESPGWPVWVGLACALAALVAVVLFAMLWEPSSARHPSPLAVPGTVSGASTPATPPQLPGAYRTDPAAPPPPPVGELPSETPERQVAALLEERRPQIVDRCWPRVGAGAQDRVSATYYFTFDAEGREVGRSLKEERGERAPADLRRCVFDALSAPLLIPAPGRPASVEAYVSYP